MTEHIEKFDEKAGLIAALSQKVVDQMKERRDDIIKDVERLQQQVKFVDRIAAESERGNYIRYVEFENGITANKTGQEQTKALEGEAKS